MNKFNFLRQTLLMLAVFSMVLISCEDEEELGPDPIASFQSEISATNYLEVSFTNYSTNATSYSWSFGDGETSVEKDPVHTFAAVGEYTVTLTATNDDEVSKEFSETFTLTDPLEALRALVGDNGKTWRLIREGKSIGVSENPETAFGWWGLDNDGTRPCVYQQSWTFNPDGTMVFDDAGVFWGDDYIFADTQDVFATCFTASDANMINKDGVDISAWLSGTHQFAYDPSAGKITLTGEGAWIGIAKVSPAGDVAVPQSSLESGLVITEEDGYDLMVLSVTGEGWYWQFNYASYTTATEPDIVSFRVDFDFTVDGKTVTFVNNSNDATSYSWDFGDGNSSTEENPVHTYAAEGAYDVVLTGTGANGSKEAAKSVTISLSPTVLAPTPTQAEADVISIYSDAYTDVAGVNIDPDWGQATVTQEVDILSEKVIKMTGLNYQGIDWSGTPQDVSSKTMLHVDVYCLIVTDINLSVIGGGENAVTLATEAGVWMSFDIPLSEYTVPNLAEVIQVKFDDAGTAASPTIFVDNIYFY